jgi:hypothetical protein
MLGCQHPRYARPPPEQNPQHRSVRSDLWGRKSQGSVAVGDVGEHTGEPAAHNSTGTTTTIIKHARARRSFGRGSSGGRPPRSRTPPNRESHCFYREGGAPDLRLDEPCSLSLWLRPSGYVETSRRGPWAGPVGRYAIAPRTPSQPGRRYRDGLRHASGALVAFDTHSTPRCHEERRLWSRGSARRRWS